MNRRQQRIAMMLLTLCIALAGCSHPTHILPVTADATPQTQALYRNMGQLATKGFMFGHQDANYYGHTWFEEPGRCDVREACGSNPALYGFDFIEMTNPAATAEAREASAERLRRLIRDARSRGGVTTLMWHYINPVGKRSFYFKEDSVAAVPMILPGGSHHDALREGLDQIAAFANTLTDTDGQLIPIIFRPWHEYDGDWFWWGTPHHCSREEFVALWRFTVSYLRDTKQVRNFLYAISPDCGFNNTQEYLACWPGDEYVDIVGMDNYWDLRADGGEHAKFVDKLRVLDSVSVAKNKPAALTETGVEGIPDPQWWTGTLLRLIGQSEARLSYVMLWRNAYQSEKHYYAPFAGEHSITDFIRFRQTKGVLFEEDLPDMYN